MTNKNSIPLDVALKLCQKFREEKKVKLFSQCWGCVKFSKGDSKKMCFYDPPENRGCRFVNEKYDRLNSGK